MARGGHDYIPAAGHDWLLPLYDPLLRWVFREDVWKRRLVEEAAIGPGHRVLDLGCGTGTLALWLKQRHPDARVSGLDVDPKVLAIARRKVERARADITLDRGSATELPYPPLSFDRVLSSLVFHHLARDQKRRALSEVVRILAPGGTLHIVDFGRPATAIGARLAGLLCRGESIRDHLEGRLTEWMREAGLREVEETGRERVLFASLCFHRGSRDGRPRESGA